MTNGFVLIPGGGSGVGGGQWHQIHPGGEKKAEAEDHVEAGQPAGETEEDEDVEEDLEEGERGSLF